ncbi:MAG: hypothetical protein IKM20_09925 [Erysipelotrichales bacterium]|nr:hypothetical protein [Erysipelotrichales bacterium]
MRILFINLPYYGHVIPTIGLVQALIKNNHQVTYLLPYDWEDKVKDSGANFYGYDNHNKLDKQVRNAFKATEAIINDYDIVIYEQFFFLGKHLAEKYGKKAVRIFTAPATNQAIMHDYISAGGPLSIFRFKLIGKLWTADAIKGLGINLKTDCWLDEIVENPPDINLVYTMEELQPQVESFSKEKFYFLGPSVYNRKEEVITINNDKPIIYISLGTIINGGIKFFKSCIKAFKDEDVTVVMAVGKKLQISKLGAIPSNFMVLSYAPQLTILKQADVFITHGGMNSISEAMSLGVPMVVVPFGSDQPTNAKQVTKLGLGKQLDYHTINSKVLNEVVMSILKDERIKQQTLLMKEKIANSLGNSGAVKIIEDYYKKF